MTDDTAKTTQAKPRADTAKGNAKAKRVQTPAKTVAGQPAKPAAAETVPAAKPTVPSVTENVTRTFGKGLNMTTEYERMMQFSNGNVEAVMAASKVVATGLEDIAREVTSFVKTTVEDSVSTSSALFACKGIQDVYDLQTKQAQKFWDQWLTESTKISEMSFKVMNDSIAPISERFTSTVNQMGKSAV